ncbi:CACTA transposable element [Tanacetum coccineum]|uniref:CACTA transposable element n=1 Tax=Tanacetum coccineum TaxID=301880 RepID=A0ABQ5B8A8_9ASTR
MPNCPVCKESRYKKKTKAGKLVAKKIVRYFPLTPRLQRMFNTKHIAKWMTWMLLDSLRKKSNLQHVAGHIDNIQHTTVDVYERNSLMLTMLIPGPKSPAKDIDVYLQPLIKELQELWKGFLTGWSGQGYYACPTCNVDTPSMAVKNKIAYVGHRRFLRTRHPQRSKFKEYYGSKEPTPKPRKFSELEIQLQISKVLKRRPGKHPDIAKKNPKPNRELELN